MLRDFIKYSSIAPKLIRSVVRQSGGWDYFKEQARDVRDHGAQNGFSGWIYYSETMPFFRRNRNLILDLARAQAWELGLGLTEMVLSFNYLSEVSEDSLNEALYRGTGPDVVYVYNVMSWFAFEEVAREFCDWREC